MTKAQPDSNSRTPRNYSKNPCSFAEWRSMTRRERATAKASLAAAHKRLCRRIADDVKTEYGTHVESQHVHRIIQQLAVEIGRACKDPNTRVTLEPLGSIWFLINKLGHRHVRFMPAAWLAKHLGLARTFAHRRPWLDDDGRAAAKLATWKKHGK